MTQPLVSIIIPSYNQAHFIGQTLDSVFAQDYKNIEVLVLDGASSDGTVELLKKYSDRLAYWVSEKDAGQSDAVNKGLQRAKGDFIGWINSDDLYYPNAVSEGMKQLLAHPEASIVFGDHDVIDADNKVLHVRREIPYSMGVSLYTKACYHANLTGLFRKSCFEQAGLLRTDLHYTMDFEFYLRVSALGMRILHNSKIVGSYRLHETSKTVSEGLSSKWARESLLIQSEYYEKLQVSSLNKRVLPKYYKVYRLIRKLFFGCYSLNQLLSSVRVNRSLKQ